METNYDLSTIRKNPYTKMLKQQITINIDKDTIQYFKDMSEESKIPYQTLINFYLMDCKLKKRDIKKGWD